MSRTYKISELPASTTISNDDLLVIVNTVSYVTKKLTAQKLLAYITGSSFNSLNIGSFTALSSSVVDVSSTSPALRITQRGSGEAIRVEDSTNVDSTPFVVDSVGNVGVGTSSPANKLHVKSVGEIVSFETTAGIGSNYIRFKNGTGNLGYFGYGGGSDNHLNIANEAASSDITLAAGASERLRITSAGNVGIGTSSPYVFGGGGLTVGSTTSGKSIVIQSSGDGVNGLLQFRDLNNSDSLQVAGTSTESIVYSYSTRPIIFYTNGAERVRITSAGNVGIGTNGPTYQLQLSTDSAAKPSTNTWTVASDIRVKENIKNYSKGLETLTKINPVTYDYNGKAGFNSEVKNNVGLIAQDILDILPESVSTYKTKLNPEDKNETELYNFNSHALTYIMINSIKELVTEVNKLKAEIQLLKSGNI